MLALPPVVRAARLCRGPRTCWLEGVTTTLHTRQAVELHGVTRRYGTGAQAVTALDRVTIGFAPASFTAVMGPSGSGKSTLLHCAAGLDGVSEGRVLVDGVELGPLREKARTRLRRDRIGFVFQAFNL